MKVVILAGGLGTRLSEETGLRPKPMAEIGERPILWHIMKIYSHYGFNDFVICAGYKAYMIKEYFHNFWLHNCDVTFDMRTHETEVHQDDNPPWRVTVVDTGDATMTGGRLKRVQEHVGNETFMLTYGDGVSNVDVSELLAFHKSHGKEATLTAVQPLGRFGALELNDQGGIDCFREKPRGDDDWINGGFFVLEPAIFDRIEADSTIFEGHPLSSAAEEGQLVAFRHADFWQPMDTLRDKRYLEDLWNSGKAPWKVW
ncbi:MAG TPA: glucose-1-phosphate cytidylyltransferase [Coriobacteriia bacterium]|nr:glucose-1-phosphate cytidylyltransferase [Coriobacteriia bacterium]